MPCKYCGKEWGIETKRQKELHKNQCRDRLQAEENRRRQAEELAEWERVKHNKALQLLGRLPEDVPTLSNLDNMAINIHKAYDWGGRDDQCVTAVVRLRNDKHIIFAQRYMNAMGEYAATHYHQYEWIVYPGGTSQIQHIHAEMWAIVCLHRASELGNAMGIGVSKEICCQCEVRLREYDIPFTLGYTTGASANWADPNKHIEVVPVAPAATPATNTT